MTFHSIPYIPERPWVCGIGHDSGRGLRQPEVPGEKVDVSRISRHFRICSLIPSPPGGLAFIPMEEKEQHWKLFEKTELRRYPV